MKHPLSRPEAWKLDAFSDANSSAHEDSARRGYAKIPSDCRTILASGMPIMTTRRGPREDDDEHDENTVDSTRSGIVRRSDRCVFAPIDRPAAAGGGQFTIMNLSTN